MNTTVGEERDGGTDNVDNTNGQGTTLQAVTESHQGVGSFTGLRNEDTGVISEDGSLSIEEIGSQLDSDRNLGEFLKDSTDSHARVVTGTTGNEDDAAASSNGRHVRSETTQSNVLVGDVETTSHGVDNRLGLLENLLLHEVVELALHDLLKLKLKGLDGSDVRAAIGLLESVDVQGALVDVGDVVVLEVHDLLGVLDNGRGIGGEEELGGHGHAIIGHESTRLRAVQKRLVRGAEQVVLGGEEVGHVLLESSSLGSSLGGKGGVLIAILNINKVDLHAALSLDANNEGRTLSGGNNLVGVVDGLDEQTVGTLELVDNGLGEVGEANLGVLVVDVLGELGNALGIGLGLKLEALALEKNLQLLVVGNDTIVDDGEFPGGVGSFESNKLAIHPYRFSIS